jgi:multidrug efflux pump subunit AcrB
MMVQDPPARGYRALEGATFAMMGAAAQEPDQVQQVFSTYNTGSPRIAADVDRDKALMMGVQPSEVFDPGHLSGLVLRQRLQHCSAAPSG